MRSASNRLCPSQSHELMRLLDDLEVNLRQFTPDRMKKTAELVLKEIDELRSEYGLGVMDGA